MTTKEQTSNRWKSASVGLVMRGLTHAQSRHADSDHVTAQQLVDAVYDVAVCECGLLAGMTLTQLGIRTPQQIGELVYHQIRVGRIQTSPRDDMFAFGILLARPDWRLEGQARDIVRESIREVFGE